jgi:hypothetical protein
MDIIFAPLKAFAMPGIDLTNAQGNFGDATGAERLIAHNSMGGRRQE